MPMPIRWMLATALLSVGCKKQEAVPEQIVSSAPPSGASTPAVSVLVYNLELAAPPCRARSACLATIKLVALDGYHVNKEYPYKFVAAEAPGVTFLGKADPRTFSRATGDFVENDETTGTMTVRFQPASVGTTTISGAYKLSVCSGDQCRIDQREVILAVPVN